MTSIIITYYQNINMLKNCLYLLTQTLIDQPDIEIIVVNDNPSINLQLQLSGQVYAIPIRIIELPENRGHSGACNAGVKNSSGSILIFMDSDIIVSGSWLEELRKTYDSHPKRGAVASTILDFSNDQIVYFGMELYKSESIKPLHGAMRQHTYSLHDQKMQIVTSGCMMIERCLFNDVGGFDESLFNSCNDLDLSMKLNAIGCENYVSAQSIVYHRGNGAGAIRFASHTYARSLFFQKWGAAINDNCNALCTLKQLYSHAFVAEAAYLIIDLSSSIFSDQYLDCLYQAHNITVIDKYRIRPKEKSIILTDLLLWDVCRLSVPIIYFADDYRSVLSNKLWFRMRENGNDLIVDKNGNIISPMR